MNTPKSLGYFFPPEWHKHEATWLTLPHNDHSWQGDKLPAMYPEYFAFIKAIAQGEKVRLVLAKPELETWVKQELLKIGMDLDQLECFIHASNDAWCRDHGPAFLLHKNRAEKALVDWNYNAWGGKYPPFDDDDRIPKAIADAYGYQRFFPNIVMEGGSVEFNGAGTLLTSRSCLLNPNRNPHLNQAQIEAYLQAYYGVDQVLWVGDGIVGDDTDGHIDDTVRFVNEDTVVAVTESNPMDENYAVLQANFKELQAMRLLNGKALNIVPLPMPDPVRIDGFRAPGSYANFYICNAAVLVPTFSCPQDEVALGILEQLFKDRPVIGLPAQKIIWGQGSFHCLSQQEPAILHA